MNNHSVSVAKQTYRVKGNLENVLPRKLQARAAAVGLGREKEARGTPPTPDCGALIGGFGLFNPQSTIQHPKLNLRRDLQDAVSPPDPVLYPDPYILAGLGTLDGLMFDLDGIHHLGDIRGVALDADGVPDAQGPGG